MNSRFIKLISLLTAALITTCIATGCGSKQTTNDKPAQSSAQTDDNKQTNDKATQSDSSSSAEPQGKYANMETYEKNGVKYGKTDTGKEVAISGENMQKLIGEYQKVQGTDSQAERDLLDQIQVILDNAQQMPAN